MPKFSLSSLRCRAIVLVLLAILPLLARTLYSHVEQRRRAIDEVQRDELVAARNMATVLETLVKSTRQLLAALARMPQVQQREGNYCNAMFAGLMKECPSYAIIAGGDPEGWIFASSPLPPGPINMYERPFFQLTKRTRDFVMGEPALGRFTKKYLITLSYPIYGPEGRFNGVIWAGVSLDWLGEALGRSGFPPDAGLAFCDSRGKVLFRYPDPLKYIGGMLPQALKEAMAAKIEGTAAGIGLPGDERLFAFTRLSPPWQDFRVVIGLPRVSAVPRVNEELRRNLAWLGLVALLALAAAWFGSGFFLIRPVRNLATVTERLAAGDLTVRAGPGYPGGELGQLAQSFDGMADSLQARDAELKKAEEELRHRVQELARRTRELEAANKEMEDFTYTVSHDLRAPLRSIVGFARIVLEEYGGKLDAEGKRYLNIIHLEARKMGQLIDDLLALTRLGRREMIPGGIDMRQLAQDVWEDLLVHNRGRELEIEVGPLPEAWGDQAMILQVWWHLLDNAIKFTREKRPGSIRVSGWSEAEENVYCVADNGAGLDMKYVNRIFEVFQRLHLGGEFEGTGVGLAIVKRIIDRHRGRVWAEGKIKAGATFCFAIPRGKKEAR